MTFGRGIVSCTDAAAQVHDIEKINLPAEISPPLTKKNMT
jgi:hypothetical protein